MFNRLQLREIIAWMALALAFILFSVTIAFAQTKNVNTEVENGNVHISISNTQNGITHNFDTSFVLTDESDIEKIIESFNEPDSTGVSVRVKSDKSDMQNDDSERKFKRIIIHKGEIEQISEETDKISKELEISIKNLNDCLENLNEKLKCDIIYLDKVDEDIVVTKKGNKVIIENYSDKNEGQKNKQENIKMEEKDNIPGVSSFKYYPNPTTGNLNVSFNVKNKCDVSVEVVDASGKVIFKNKNRSFEGKYTEEFNLGDSDDGSYILKITAGENSMSRKIILKKN